MMFWQECLEKGVVRKSSPDKELAKSLVKMSELRLNFVKSVTISRSNAPIVITESYEALREICEALIALNGFKVYSHECITVFLKEIAKDSYLAEVFDRYRKIRNGVNYYGRQVSEEDAKQSLKDIADAISRTKSILKI